MSLGVSPYQWFLCALLLLCLSSFTWAMRSFFVQPEGFTQGMKLTTLSGFICAILHFAALLFAKDVTAEQCAIAAGLYFLSLALFWWAIAANRAKPLSAVFSPDQPAHVMQAGPYRYIRHPFYCSYLLTWVAGVIGSGQIWLAVTAIGMFWLYLRAAHVEEQKFAGSSLAGVYAAYRNRAGLFLPNPVKMLSQRRL